MNTQLKNRFREYFGREPEMVFSAPGRTELGGNHTDHQLGRVLAGAVSLDSRAAVAPTDRREIRVLSEGYPLCVISLDALFPREEEKGRTAALVRGVAAGIREAGLEPRGFDAYVQSRVLPGSGLSSSAAFEVLMGTVLNGLCGGKLDPVAIARIGQRAENLFFGKPCGLMDQTASAVGNIVAIDFENPESPRVEPVDFDFSACGHALCIIDSGADHADLTDEYAAIPGELAAVCRALGKERLRQVSEAEFYARLPALRAAAGDRALLRAMHVFEENRRVDAQVAALRAGDFPAFLALVKQSGRSSWQYLQNVVPTGAVRHQELGLALALTERLLGGRGACRVHGGGFAGTLQAFVPLDMLEGFQEELEAVLGKGKCHVLSIRQEGGVRLE
ncbi:MAG: galactokinase [Oscillospiraceae bacterium]|nr:galactokinase [Oscillospiraceae bacterium]